MINGTRFRLNLEVTRQTKLAEDIARGQTEIATGKKILAPSDDPIGAARVAEIGRAQATEATWLRNVEAAALLAARSDALLDSAVTSLDRAKELMLAASSGTTSDQNRATMAAELRSIATEMASLRTALDPRGEPLFRTNGELEIPVSAGVRIAPVPSRAAIFDAPVDVLAVLDAAAAAAVEPDPVLREAAMTASLAALDGATSQVINARADQGLRADQLDKVRERLKSSELQLEEQRASIESTNVPETMARLQSKMLTLEAAQAIFAKVNQRSLFDLLR